LSEFETNRCSAGNYIISGGQESTLVLWQLDTNKTEFLPHLPAPVRNIVVSPTGTSYAVKLINNSVMVLSTSELVPKTHISGIQATAWDIEKRMSSLLPEAKLKTVDLERAPKEFSGYRSSAAAINPLKPTEILLAVPSSNPSGILKSNAPFLQTFDMASSHQISRQALARTNTTTLNRGPERNKLMEPDVKLIAVNGKGRWLATVDEWNPPTVDLGATEPESGESQGERCREVFLKFWLFNAEKNEWELVTRVDSPHSSAQGSADNSIRALLAEPSKGGFATIGDDGTVRTWRTKTRTRDNVAVIENGVPLKTWSCSRSIHLNHDSPDGVDGKEVQPNLAEASLSKPALAYSADGSLLAASYAVKTSQQYPTIYLIAAETGNIRHIIDGLQLPNIVDLAIIGPFLIILGTGVLQVYDLVRGEVSWSMGIKSSKLSDTSVAEMLLLATDQTSGTFALAIPTVSKQANQDKGEGVILDLTTTRLLVFDPIKGPEALLTTTINCPVTALLATGGDTGGYAVLDSSAELHVLEPRGGALISGSGSAAIAAVNSLNSSADEEDIDIQTVMGAVDDDQDDDEEAEIAQQGLDVPDPSTFNEDNDIVDKPVVRADQLSDVFDQGPAYAMPSVSDLFESVAGLFSRKPPVA
jgi:NET1-associated nuclear protein 1 (U3 small nucleolar RNA-associated protein 17)